MKDSSSTSKHGSKEQCDMHQMNKYPYYKLFWMLLLSFIAMYLLMYAMVNKLSNVIPNVNQFYMAGLMSTPMLIIELLLMKKMYPNKKLNFALHSVGVIAALLFYAGIRNQAAVTDEQFLKSMIPHHAGAILMVEQSNLSDREVQQLGRDIIASQQKEIDFMKAKLRALKNK